MQSDRVDPFPDNWAYLKAELNWLDRLLMLAVARQRKDSRLIDRLSQSRADRVTSHWWKGLVSLEGTATYDDCVPSRPTTTDKTSGLGYQKQLELRVRASLECGHNLGLPLLRDRLNLSVFEKNVVLMSLAPEVNHRYARLYSYLQGHETGDAAGLPTIDLILRLLCRNDLEWRSARQRLTTSSQLIQHELLEIVGTPDLPLLSRSLKLPDALVNYLLSDQPDSLCLEALLQVSVSLPAIATVSSPSHWLKHELPPAKVSADGWSHLILPEPVLATLQQLSHSMQWSPQVHQLWDAAANVDRFAPTGAIALMVGAAGTGKTIAAQTIAQSLESSLAWADLALLNDRDSLRLLQEIVDQSPTVLLLKSAQRWLNRHPSLPPTVLHQFLQSRQTQHCVTLFSVHSLQTVRPYWQPHLGQVIRFPAPNQAARLKLWQQTFPAQVVLDANVDWAKMAQWRLTGGDIRTIAYQASSYAVAAASSTVTMAHLQQAMQAFTQSRRSQGY
ncbi:MAG: hypothetical protein KME16_16125 [Scytolyngbya sp. HA4215-MV1]|jgi:hypothetical protein|nr:hypothetical protein [Scytolyngbya sp. HA4215-MV1]